MTIATNGGGIVDKISSSASTPWFMSKPRRSRTFNELARVLKPDGVAFLHHSNYGTYQRSTCRRTIARVIRPTPTLGPGCSLTVGDLPRQALAGPKRDRCLFCGSLRPVRPALCGTRTCQLGRGGPPPRLHVGGCPSGFSLGSPKSSREESALFAPRHGPSVDEPRSTTPCPGRIATRSEIAREVRLISRRNGDERVKRQPGREHMLHRERCHPPGRRGARVTGKTDIRSSEPIGRQDLS